jgi:hypothetical protein
MVRGARGAQPVREKARKAATKVFDAKTRHERKREIRRGKGGWGTLIMVNSVTLGHSRPHSRHSPAGGCLLLQAPDKLSVLGAGEALL